MRQGWHPLPHFNIKWTSLPLTCILYLLIHRAVTSMQKSRMVLILLSFLKLDHFFDYSKISIFGTCQWYQRKIRFFGSIIWLPKLKNNRKAQYKGSFVRMFLNFLSEFYFCLKFLKELYELCLNSYGSSL